MTERTFFLHQISLEPTSRSSNLHQQLSEERRSLFLCMLFVSAIWAINTYLLLRSETVFVNNMPIDVLHTILGAERIRMGEVPHSDFHTPIGALAFYLLAWLTSFSGDIVYTLKLSNVVVGGMVLALSIWLAVTRLSQISFLLVGIYLVMLSMSFSWDEAEAGVTFAMYYNRWSWCLFIFALLLCIAPRQPSKTKDLTDAVILAFIFFALAFIKVSFFVSVLVGTAIAATVFGRSRIFLLAVPIGVLVSGLAIGLDIMPLSLSGYLQDIIDAARSPIRVRSMTDIADAPLLAKNIGQTLAVLVLILICFRLKLWEIFILTGMILGFSAANTVQNYGNGLAGFFAAAILALEFIVSRKDFPEMDRTLAVAAAAFIFAAALPLVYYSQLTLVAVSTENEEMIAPFSEPSRLSSFRTKKPTEEIEPGEKLFHYAEPKMIGTETIESCAIVEDHLVYLQSLSEATDALWEIGLQPEDKVVSFGLINPFWLTTGTAPIPGGHLWYVGKVSVPKKDLLKNVRFFALEKCAHKHALDKTWQEAREVSGIDFSRMKLRAETQLWMIFESPGFSDP